MLLVIKSPNYYTYVDILMLPDTVSTLYFVPYKIQKNAIPIISRIIYS